MVYGTYNYIVTRAYKPTYILGPHIVVGGLEHFLSFHILTNSYFSEGWAYHQPAIHFSAGCLYRCHTALKSIRRKKQIGVRDFDLYSYGPKYQL